jgi:hypothetical protein
MPCTHASSAAVLFRFHSTRYDAEKENKARIHSDVGRRKEDMQEKKQLFVAAGLLLFVQ